VYFLNRFSLRHGVLLLAASLPCISGQVSGEGEAVSYEAFGAKGDGVTDDLPAILKAHAHANKNGLPVKSKPDATYHLGTQALTAIIATDTYWGTSRFIIDDSKGVENSSNSIFEVRSLLAPVPLGIEKLKRGQTLLDVKPAKDCLVYVENEKQKLFIRRGLNQNDGSSQKEVFILRRDGSIEGGIDWEYETVTRIEAQPIDDMTLTLCGGIFTNIANRGGKSRYWARNISIRRSNVIVHGVTHQVTGEGDHGQPYSGFLNANRCAKIMFRDCVIDARKTYSKDAGDGKTVPMGSYGYSADLVVDFRMKGCRMGNDIHDRSRWGVTGTNFMKDILLEDCELSRMDVHQGVSGSYIIRRTTLGHMGLNAIGRGRLIVEDSTLHGRSFIRFREDYGSTWDGTVLIRNSRWIPPGKGSTLIMFDMSNDGLHDFGYPCSMPSVITFEGLTVDDSNFKGLLFFGNPTGKSAAKRPFPYRLTERIKIKSLNTATGVEPRVSAEKDLLDAVKVIR
jgi:hypothetical protein